MISLLVILVGTITLSAQGKEIEFEKYSLDNGLKVLLHEDHSTPIVAVSVMYHVGSKNENPERTGFAHFFEHLLFEGSENIGRGEFDKYIQQAGGTNNANTSHDRTYYYEILPSNQLELGLWLESERMLHAKVEEKGIETQREVVKEEKRLRMDNQPYASFPVEISRRIFSRHPYRWMPIGSMEDLDAASEEDYVNFYKAFYVPNNAILSIAGDIDLPTTRKLIERYFAGIPGGADPIYRPEMEEPELTREIRDTVYDNIQLPAVIQSYRVPALGEQDYYAVQLLTNLLSQGQSSRLYRSLVDEQQLGLTVVNLQLALEDAGVAVVLGITNMGVDPQKLEAGIDEQIKKVQSELISEKEFRKLQNQVESDFVTANASVAGIAESLANYEMFFGDAGLINTELERFRMVTREDIRDAARKYYDLQRRVVLYYLPKPH